MAQPLDRKALDLINAWWRACNDLAVGMIYLQDNPRLREPNVVLACCGDVVTMEALAAAVPMLGARAAHLKEAMKNAILDNVRHAHEHGTDRPEVANWTWP